MAEPKMCPLLAMGGGTYDGAMPQSVSDTAACIGEKCAWWKLEGRTVYPKRPDGTTNYSAGASKWVPTGEGHCTILDTGESDG